MFAAVVDFDRGAGRLALRQRGDDLAVQPFAPIDHGEARQQVQVREAAGRLAEIFMA